MPKAGYHHGNLRQALVEAALEVLERQGSAGFSLADAAKAAGVTPAAVYRHFKGRDDLLAEVARQGQERLALMTDTASKDSDPLQALLKYGAAFLQFCEKYPSHFAAIFTSNIAPDHTDALATATKQTQAIANRIAERLRAETHLGKNLPSETMACHIHALCRGTAQMRPKPDINVLQEALATYFAGLSKKTDMASET